jgi:hypothetical protein
MSVATSCGWASSRCRDVVTAGGSSCVTQAASALARAATATLMSSPLPALLTCGSPGRSLVHERGLGAAREARGERNQAAAQHALVVV